MVPVYDKKNPERLLGYIPSPGNPNWMREFRFPLMDMSPFSLKEAERFSPYVRTASLEVQSKSLVRASNDSWEEVRTIRYFLVTDAPLEDLHCLRGWRFPSVHGN